MHFYNRLQFLVLVLSCLVVSFIPLIHVPFQWFETLFHESSHAIVATLTGGHVARIELFLNGAGLTWSSGGFRIPIAFGGYAGAILWGAGVYWMASNMDSQKAQTAVKVFIGLGLLETIFWLAFSITTYLIMAVLLLTLSGLLSKTIAPIAQWGLKWIGLYVLLSGLRAPLVILGLGGVENDAKTLAHLTFIPQIVWVALWVGMGILVLIRLYRREGLKDGVKLSTPLPNATASKPG